MALEAGSVFVRLAGLFQRDEFDKWDKAIDNERAKSRTPIEQKLGADTKPLDADLAAARGKVSAFAHTQADAKVGIDENAFDRAIARVAAKLKRFTAPETIKATVDLDTTAARAKLAALKAEAASIGGVGVFGASAGTPMGGTSRPAQVLMGTRGPVNVGSTQNPEAVTLIASRVGGAATRGATSSWDSGPPAPVPPTVGAGVPSGPSQDPGEGAAIRTMARSVDEFLAKLAAKRSALAAAEPATANFQRMMDATGGSYPPLNYQKLFADQAKMYGPIWDKPQKVDLDTTAFDAKAAAVEAEKASLSFPVNIPVMSRDPKTGRFVPYDVYAAGLGTQIPIGGTGRRAPMNVGGLNPNDPYALFQAPPPPPPTPPDTPLAPPGGSGGDGGRNAILAWLFGGGGGGGGGRGFRGGGFLGGAILGGLFGAGIHGPLGAVGGAVGLGPEHLIGAGLALGGSAVGGLAGAGVLGLGAAGQFAVGGGSDIAVLKSTVADTKALATAQAAVNTAILTYGKNSTQAAAATRAYNVQVQQLGGTVTKTGKIIGAPGVAAEAQLAKAATALNTFWDKATQNARVQAVKIGMQVVNLGHDYVPKIAQAATANLALINKGLKPLFTWLEGPHGMAIFNTLENNFKKNIPAAMDAFKNGVELLLRVMADASNYTGGFTRKLDELLKRWNSLSASDLNAKIAKLVNDFRIWEQWVKALAHDLHILFKAGSGEGNDLVVTFTHILQKWGEWMSSVKGQNFLHTFFENRKMELMALITLVGSVLHLFGMLYVALQPLVPAVTAFAKIASNVLGALGKYIIAPIAAALALILKTFVSLGQGANVFGTIFKDAVIGPLGLFLVTWKLFNLETAKNLLNIRGYIGAIGVLFRQGPGKAWLALKDMFSTGPKSASDKQLTAAEVMDKAADKMVVASDRMSGAATKEVVAGTEQEVAARTELAASGGGLLGGAKGILGKIPFIGKIFGGGAAAATAAKAGEQLVLPGLEAAGGAAVGAGGTAAVAAGGGEVAAGFGASVLAALPAALPPVAIAAAIGGAIFGAVQLFGSHAQSAAQRLNNYLGNYFRKGLPGAFSGPGTVQTMQDSVQKLLDDAARKLHPVRLPIGITRAGLAPGAPPIPKLTPKEIQQAKDDYRKAGQIIAGGLIAGDKKFGGIGDPAVLLDQLIGAIKNRRPAIQAAAAEEMLAYAQGLEKTKQVPRGTVKAMIRQLESEFPALTKFLGKSGKDAASIYTKEMDFKAVTTKVMAFLRSMTTPGGGNLVDVATAIHNAGKNAQDQWGAAMNAILTDSTSKLRSTKHQALALLKGMVADAQAQLPILPQLFKKASADGKQQLLTNMALAVEGVHTLLNNGVISAAQAMKKIDALLSGELRALNVPVPKGLTTAALQSLLNTNINVQAAGGGVVTYETPTQLGVAPGASHGLARGGVIPGSEFGLGDEMTLVDPHGVPRAKMAGDELIFTRHQAPYVEAGLQMLGWGGASDLWSTITRPHGYAQGGELPAFFRGGQGGGGGSFSSRAKRAFSNNTGIVKPVGPGFTFAGVDEGVDYSGSGPIGTIGPARFTRVSPQNSGTGWPGAGDGAHGTRGAMIVYALTGGPDSGKYVYLAENIDPIRGLHVGSTMPGGSTYATARGVFPYLEMGWSADSVGDPLGRPGYVNHQPTVAGQNFYATITGGRAVPLSGGSAAQWKNIMAPHIGIAGPVGSLARAAVNRVAAAANAYGRSKSGSFTGSGVAGNYKGPLNVTFTNPNQTISFSDAVGLASKAGFSAVASNLFGHVAVSESNLRPGIVNSIGATGLWQIYNHPDLVARYGDMRNPWHNAEAAKSLFDGGRMAPWVASRAGWGSFAPSGYSGGGKLPGFATGGRLGANAKYHKPAAPKPKHVKSPKLPSINKYINSFPIVKQLAYDDTAVSYLNDLYSRESGVLGLYDSAGLTRADLDILVGIEAGNFGKAGTGTLPPTGWKGQDPVKYGLWGIQYNEYQQLPKVIAALTKTASALEGAIPTTPTFAHAGTRGRGIDRTLFEIHADEQEITTLRADLKLTTEKGTLQHLKITAAASAAAFSLANQLDTATTQLYNDQSAAIQRTNQISALVSQLEAQLPFKSGSAYGNLQQRIAQLQSDRYHKSNAIALNNKISKIHKAALAAAQKYRKQGFALAWQLVLQKYALHKKIDDLVAAVKKLKELLVAEQKQLGLLIGTDSGQTGSVTGGGKKGDKPLYPKDSGINTPTGGLLAELQTRYSGSTPGSVSSGESILQQLGDTGFNILSLKQQGADVPDSMVSEIIGILTKLGVTLPPGALGGGAGGGASASAALAQFLAFQASRANIFSSFGSNFAPAGTNPFSTAAGLGAGTQYYAAASGPGSGTGFSGGGRMGGNTTHVNITQNFGGGPSDPHTYSAGLSHELNAMI